MKIASVKAAVLCATSLSALIAGPAYAQSAAPVPAANDADTIVVTARRVEERLQDVPISITVFNPQQLADRNITSTTDLATYTPGLALNSRYGPDKASFAIRGFSQDLNTAPTVAVYFAEVVAPRLQSNIGGGNGAGPGAVFDLQNIQVLKGPQGTLFGRNTTGGAILLVPQKPTDRLEGYVEGTYGNYDEKRVQAVLNIPLADTFKVRFGLDRNKRDGYIRSFSGIGPDDYSNIDYTSARLSIVANLTPDLENYTVASYTKSDTHGTVPKLVYYNAYFDHPNTVTPPYRNPLTGTVGSTGLGALLGASVRAQYLREKAAGYGFYDVDNNDPDPFVKSRTWQVINTTTWNATDNLTVKNIVSYGEARERYSFSLDGDDVTFPFVITSPGIGGNQGSESTFTEEFQLQGHTANSRLTYQAGYYMEISDPLGKQQQYTQIAASCTNIYAFQCTTLSPLISSVSIAHNNYIYHNYALYAQATYKFTDTVSLTLGGRNTWDWEREDGNNVRVIPTASGPLVSAGSPICSRSATPAGYTNPLALLGSNVCDRSFVTKSSKPTWLIDVDWKPSADTLLYAKYARGYRAGGINEANVGAEIWQPEKVDDYEVGFKTGWRGKIFGNFAIDGFWNNFRNQQTSVTIPQCAPAIVGGVLTNGCSAPAPTGINGIQNVGKSRMRGVEVDGSIGTGPIRLDVGYAYLDAKVLGGSVPFCDNTRYDCANASYLTAGSRLPFSPKNRITMTGTFTLPVDESFGHIAVSATYTHTDSQYNSHSDDVAFAQGAIPYNAGITPATNLVNLNLNWRDVARSPIDVAVFVTNLTKEKYNLAIANALSSLGGESVIPGEPRMYGVRVRYHFGQ